MGCLLLIFVLFGPFALGTKFSLLPDCTALSPDGFYFDWTSLNTSFSATWCMNSNWCYKYTSIICGSLRCNGYDCGFCDSSSCRGWILPNNGYYPVWSAKNKTVGSVMYDTYDGSASVQLNCNASATVPIVSAPNLFQLSYTSSSVCPIGRCPNACNYFSSWGSCNPKNGFTCDCNVGFTGTSCDVSLFDHAIVSGNFTLGAVAGGDPVVVNVQPYTQDNQLMPCYCNNNPYTGPNPPGGPCYESLSSWNAPWSQDGGSVMCTNGTRSFYFASTHSSVYYLPLSFFNKTVTGSPFTVIVSPGVLQPNATTQAGAGLTKATVNQTAYFVLTLADKYGNDLGICPPDASAFYGAVYGKSIQQVSMQCDAGKIKSTYILQTPGTYNLIVRFKDQIISGFPTTVTCSS